MRKSYFITFLITLAGLGFQPSMAQLQIEVEPFASGILRPVDIAHAGDSRLFIVSRDGRVYVVNDSGQVNFTPFLDIAGRVNAASTERGLLGLAFHPDYGTNGYFYVNYTDISGSTVISRFSVTAQPNVADPASELILLSIPQPFTNHNAGDLAFGPDGYLYIPTGDGGSGGDPGNRAQNPLNLLGKMLRIDVNTGSPYAIPASNPFVNDPNVQDEIWAIGLRNPWRISFDRATGDLWIGDVGQDAFEEISMQPGNTAGGRNFGWRCYEGFTLYNATTNCPGAALLTQPVHAYSNNFNVGESVTGGFVYRGGRYGLLQGHYVFGDFETGRMWTLFPNASGGYDSRFHGQLMGFQQISTFGEDVNGELYVAAYSSGQIYRVKEICSSLIPDIVFRDDTLFAVGGETGVQWLLDGVAIVGATDTFWVPGMTGQYAVQVEPGGGCGILRSAPFAYSITGIEVSGRISAHIAPNPMQQVARLKLNNPLHAEYQLIITDLAGKTLREVSLRGEEWMIERGNLSTGVYLVTLRGPQSFSCRLIVE